MNDSRQAASRLRRELAVAQQDQGSLTIFDTDHVLATLRAAMGEPETAVALLADVWPAVPAGIDEAWVRRLCDIGAELATVLPMSLLLATTFRRAARFLRSRGFLRLAALQGTRELAIHRLRDDDPEATAAALNDLADTYRAQGRLHKVIGCADEALETYLLHEHEVGAASTLVQLGTLMIEVRRLDQAVNYLARADKVFQHLPDRVTAQAECLAYLGRALWLSGEHGAADRALNRAIALALRLDTADAEQVRHLAEEARRPS